MSYYFPKKPGRPAPTSPGRTSQANTNRRLPQFPSQGKQLGRKVAPASLARRLVALLFDYLLSVVFVWMVIIVIGVLGSVISGDTSAFLRNLKVSLQTLKTNPWLKTLVVIFGSMLYHAASYILSGGSTPGKKLLDLRIVDRKTGQNISMGKLVLRNSIGLSLSGLIFGFGYLLVFFSRDRLALHDLIFATQVVRVLP